MCTKLQPHSLSLIPRLYMSTNYSHTVLVSFPDCTCVLSYSHTVLVSFPDCTCVLSYSHTVLVSFPDCTCKSIPRLYSHGLSLSHSQTVPQIEVHSHANLPARISGISSGHTSPFSGIQIAAWSNITCLRPWKLNSRFLRPARIYSSISSRYFERSNSTSLLHST